ncbi:MAG: hypothetical protein JWM78_3280 [Verrucomicrobiaceae bacterium]|nr:hypothetical protein [Verrucomicrobiaceae bacterium]
MELKDFIKETLVQIAVGVEAAQTEVRDCGGFVNPAHRSDPKNNVETHFGVLGNGQNIFLVDFDISVTVVEETGADAKAKLQVVSFLKIGVGIESSTSNSATNRIGFKVPLGLPVDAVSEEQLKQNDAELQEKRRKQSEAIRAHNKNKSNSWMG